MCAMSVFCWHDGHNDAMHAVDRHTSHRKQRQQKQAALNSLPAVTAKQSDVKSMALKAALGQHINMLDPLTANQAEAARFFPAHGGLSLHMEPHPQEAAGDRQASVA